VSRIHVVTLPRLRRALQRVSRELTSHGFLDEKLDEVEVYLVPFGTCYGWKWNERFGHISIPAISLDRLKDRLVGAYTALIDVLRHEYGHAVADTHPGLIRSRLFRRAFFAHYDNVAPFDYEPDFHFTRYGSSCAMEDFADAFMLFLKHKGRLPAAHSTQAKRRKWSFIRKLGRAIGQGKGRW